MVEETTTEAISEETKEEVTEAATQETQEPAVKAPEFQKPLDKMTAIELREVAMEIPGITGAHAMKKEELLPLIKEYYGIEDPTPETEKRKKVHKPAASAQELKAKISQLKEKKEEVRAAKDRKQADILRKRINRLKKQTRRAAQG